MSFGLFTALTTFSRLIWKVLFEMENIENFIYDIIIFIQIFEQLSEILEELFQKLCSAGFTAKPGNCSLAYSSLICLGHVVGNERIRLISDKINTILHFQIWDGLSYSRQMLPTEV